MLADVFAFGEILSQPFMRNAFVAGTAIAVASGLVGYFLVLRSQVFSADALSHVTFTGALAALAFGVDVRIGLFASVIAVAILLSALAREGRADDVVVGSVFVWILGLGVLFLSLFTASRAASNSAGGVAALFGSIFGLDDGAVVTAVLVGMVVSAAMVFLARPLLFASLDESVAIAQGVRVRAIGVAFLLGVGLTAAEAAQAVGALLLLGLLATPGAAALRLTSRPYRAFVLSAVLAVGCTWAGLIASYQVPKLPPSFSIIAALTTAYVGAVIVDRVRGSWRPSHGSL